ncbi:hypothetical protein CBOM_00552 [Ceraceosorus bombacis]|uniref:Uncharacterized protein n=1 Tax=Ceraceosorus bombacis TaxID=401625 RepID=A0A0P1B9I2_9BASI|nr:hypothetical protein CBOM_00552 [Ceraceosorus bombacis]
MPKASAEEHTLASGRADSLYWGHQTTVPASDFNISERCAEASHYLNLHPSYARKTLYTPKVKGALLVVFQRHQTANCYGRELMAASVIGHEPKS